jgi:membrane-associated phospholipid phosphatase
LINQRDGIVGSWLGQKMSPPQRAIDQAYNMQNWEPWVRAAVIDFELLSNLYFTPHAETFTYQAQGNTVSKTSQDCVSIWHFAIATTGTDPAPTATSNRVATFIRPDLQVFKAQLDFLDQYSDLRADRASEILTELGPQYAFWSSVVPLHPERNRKTIELLDAALRLANFVEMRIKHALACHRPNELSPQVQPIILTPGHGSFPSGHSTENYMIARVLWELWGKGEPEVGEQLMREAARIAVNRTVAGVHFPVDTAAGQVLGLILGQYFIQRATGGQQFGAWRFDGERYPGNYDFEPRRFYYDLATDQEKFDASVNPPVDPSYVDKIASQPPAMSPILEWLWAEAKKEWTDFQS